LLSLWQRLNERKLTGSNLLHGIKIDQPLSHVKRGIALEGNG
jgi:hypothetical protein